MATFIASLQSYLASALQFIASLGCVQLLLSAIAYIATLLVTTFGVSSGLAIGAAWALFTLVVVLCAWVLYKLGGMARPYVASGYEWVKGKVTGLFSKKENTAPAAAEAAPEVAAA